MELIQILTGLSEGQNAGDLARQQNQINEVFDALIQTNLELMFMFIVCIALFTWLILRSFSLAKRVKRLESALLEKRAD